MPNAKSLQNLNREGTKPIYGDRKKPRNLSITAFAWEEIKRIAKEDFGLSVSEVVERIGRGDLVVFEKDTQATSRPQKATPSSPSGK